MGKKKDKGKESDSPTKALSDHSEDLNKTLTLNSKPTPYKDLKKWIEELSQSPEVLKALQGMASSSTEDTDSLYIHGNDSPLTNVGIDYPFYLDNTIALETVYRLNVGGRDIDGSGDTGMYKKWVQDSNYIFVSNLTWIFPVDTGFNYLVRLHFCETRLEVTGALQLVFSIFINNQTAVAQADVIYWSGGRGVPVYKDHVIWIPAAGPGKQDLWLALHPSDEFELADATLNGLEIFKLNKSKGSLAGPNSEPILVQTPPVRQPKLLERTKSKHVKKVTILIGLVFGGVLLLAFILCFFVFNQRRRGKKYSIITKSKSFRAPFPHTSRSTTRKSFLNPFNQFRRFSIFEIEVATSKFDDKSNKSSTIASPLPTERCRRFTILEIKEATRNFDDQNFIGSGGFGNVYKGYIDNESITVAIKRLDSSSKQGTREFTTEIEMLSQVRHVNLVSLIGYCIDEGEMILIYDYLINGTLAEHLHETNNDPLPWKKRLHICIGAARGLHYLHSEFTHTIIHRDVKTTNILLDENWIAKVSDFGLSKAAFKQEVSTTIVKGTWVLFHKLITPILCEKCIQNGNIYQIIDPYLKGKIAPRCFKKFVEIAFSCVHSKGIERPNMRDVMEELEFALKLQDDAEAENMGISPDGEIVHPYVSFFPAQWC
ncbi:receptor-like protein kinase FERONIA [Jatropha curcas]|uniref:receptor-like protein kinase FERONIA n=1 Tax=Jatropha curcas TaxID=180498 RepID=UPI0018941ACE|nr:receptor-like protein kinase FERONIA [Jatropha curcas]